MAKVLEGERNLKGVWKIWPQAACFELPGTPSFPQRAGAGEAKGKVARG